MITERLADRLVGGTGTYKGYLPPFLSEKGTVKTRVLPCTVRRLNPKPHGPDVFYDAFQIIGAPLGQGKLQQIRQKNNLSKNYGAVKILKNLLGNVDPISSRLIVEEGNGFYIVAGLLIEERLKQCASGLDLSDSEEIVFASMAEFPGLNPKNLMDKWGHFRDYKNKRIPA